MAHGGAHVRLHEYASKMSTIWILFIERVTITAIISITKLIKKRITDTIAYVRVTVFFDLRFTPKKVHIERCVAC